MFCESACYIVPYPSSSDIIPVVGKLWRLEHKACILATPLPALDPRAFLRLARHIPLQESVSQPPPRLFWSSHPLPPCLLSPPCPVCGGSLLRLCWLVGVLLAPPPLSASSTMTPVCPLCLLVPTAALCCREAQAGGRLPRRGQASAETASHSDLRRGSAHFCVWLNTNVFFLVEIASTLFGSFWLTPSVCQQGGAC